MLGVLTSGGKKTHAVKTQVIEDDKNDVGRPIFRTHALVRYGQRKQGHQKKKVSLRRHSLFLVGLHLFHHVYKALIK